MFIPNKTRPWYLHPSVIRRISHYNHLFRFVHIKELSHPNRAVDFDPNRCGSRQGQYLGSQFFFPSLQLLCSFQRVMRTTKKHDSLIIIM